MASISGRRMPNLSWQLLALLQTRSSRDLTFRRLVFNMTAENGVSIGLKGDRKLLGQLKNERPKSIFHQQGKINSDFASPSAPQNKTAQNLTKWQPSFNTRKTTFSFAKWKETLLFKLSSSNFQWISLENYRELKVSFTTAHKCFYDFKN